ncbi:MAG: hypothetical protein OHK0032_13430 [Thermodesulfovibrionales bacterium]
MRLSHEDMKEMLPDYLRGTLSGEMRVYLETHLSGCEECRGELSLITELTKINVPDPGELFFKTLPRRVRASVKEEGVKGFSLKVLLFRPLPAAATIVALLLLTVIFTPTKKKEAPELDPYFKDPFTVAVLDYGDVTEKELVLSMSKDIPQAEERIAIDESFIYPGNPMEYSYYREFASLSSKELESLYEALRKEQKTGVPKRS